MVPDVGRAILPKCVGRCIADCTKDWLVSNIADIEKVSPLVQK